MKGFWVDFVTLLKVGNVRQTINNIKTSIKEGYKGGVTENGVQWCIINNCIISRLYGFIIGVCMLFFK